MAKKYDKAKAHEYYEKYAKKGIKKGRKKGKGKTATKRQKMKAQFEKLKKAANKKGLSKEQKKKLKAQINALKKRLKKKRSYTSSRSVGVKKANQSTITRIAARRETARRQINKLKEYMNGLSPEELKKNKADIEAQIERIRKDLR